MATKRPYSIYALTHPLGVIRYVGLSKDPETRYQQHLVKAVWIQEILQQGEQPTQIILEDGLDLEQAKVREKYWMHYYEGQGFPLENIVFNEGAIRAREEDKRLDEVFRKRFAHLPEDEVRLMISLTKQGREDFGVCPWEDTFEDVQYTIEQLELHPGLPFKLSEPDMVKIAYEVMNKKARTFMEKWGGKGNG